MNRNLSFKIAGSALALVEIDARQDDRLASTTEEMLLEIVRMGIRAYEQHTGEPLDSGLIKAEAPL